jgi:hypothetical protein
MHQVFHLHMQIVKIGYQHVQTIQVVLHVSIKHVPIQQALVHGHIIIVKCGYHNVN